MNNEYLKKRAIAVKRLSQIGLVKDAKTTRTGIYVWKRIDTNGVKWFYAGQAVNIFDRQVSHLLGYNQEIDGSIRKRGLKDVDNPFGWWFEIYAFCEKDYLDELETKAIMYYINQGWQTYNKTFGSQGVGKQGMDNHKPAKGYYDGLNQGYLNARRYIAKLFEKNLKVEIQGDDGVRKQNALAKFNEFINIDNEEDEDDKQ